jgi:hypothetical protein
MDSQPPYIVKLYKAIRTTLQCVTLALIIGTTLLPELAIGAALPAGFTFSPAFSSIDVPAAQPTVQFKVALKNRESSDQAFRISVLDFGSLDEQGGVAFLGESNNDLEHKYGLAKWMKADQDQVTVLAGATLNLVVTIDNQASLAPGGHYGAVIATAVSSLTAGDTAPRVGVKQVISSLVLATKTGGANSRLNLISQSSNQSTWKLPSLVEARFKNDGNVHVVPRGVIEVRDATGTVVERGALNDGSGVILPGSYRRYTTPLLQINKAWLPGRYSIVTTYRYDGTDTTQVLTTGFWFVGNIVVVLLGVAGIVVVGCFIWIAISHIRRAQRS